VLRVDRLRVAVAAVTTTINRIPKDRIAAELQRAGLPIPKVLLRPLIQWLTSTSNASIERWLARAEQSPDEVDAYFQHSIALIAWLDGQIDTPPAILERLTSALGPAIASPSSADPGPERPPSPVH
jgi:hypothetical protein